MNPSRNLSFRDHRCDREAGNIVYPVNSRRSGGLSLGINLFPDQKTCNFNCPYCEVFPFESTVKFSLDGLNEELETFFDTTPRELKDICFSGNGEPTLSPVFPEALALVDRIREKRGLGSTPIVLITNGTGFLNMDTMRLVVLYANGRNLVPWIKLDAGTESWYGKISQSSVGFERLRVAIREFFLKAPGVIQTMICSVNGEVPDKFELMAWADFVHSILALGGKVREIHLYTQARASPEGITAPLSDEALSLVAEFLKSRIDSVPVRIFGA